VLDIREQLIVQLALFSGMRPGEILALRWTNAPEISEGVSRIFLT
jgi:integrase